jgi:predicted MFS family arabinose efflux permease
VAGRRYWSAKATWCGVHVEIDRCPCSCPRVWGHAIAFALQFVRGIGISATDVGVNSLLQREVPGDRLGTAFGTLYGGIGVAAATSYLLGAVMLELTDPRTTFVIAGAGGVLATAATLVYLGPCARRS